jgi:1-acyl-sn-glycerol-3-phosphate acyltransferase
MVNVLILLSVLIVFLIYDFVLRVGRVVNRERPVEYSEFILGLTLERIFSLIKSYRGFTLEVEDRLGDRWPERFILVSNHQSIVDIPVLGLILMIRMKKKIRFVAKKELGRGVPLVSLALKMQKHGLVTRHGDPGQALKSLDRFARNCKATKACPVIFPEGTRSKDGKLGTFHTGGLRRILSVEPIPVVVVALDGGHRIRGIKEIMRNLNGSGYKLRILDVLPPPANKHELAALTEKSKALIASALSEWRGLELAEVLQAREGALA